MYSVYRLVDTPLDTPMEKILVIGVTPDGRTFSSLWNHRTLANKAEQFLKAKYQNLIVYQVVK